jgi:hypothetical protein
MSLNDNGYQKNKVQKIIDPLTSFLEDVQCLQGTKRSTKVHFSNEGKTVKTLDRFLFEAEADKEINQNKDEADIDLGDEEEDNSSEISDVADKKEQDAVDSKFFIGANQRYFMGAGNDPLLTIVTQVSDDKIKYYQYPWKKEQIIKRDIGLELLRKGCRTWLDKNSDTHEEDLKRSIESVLSGKPGEKVTLEDYQFANVQIRYIGSEKGDDKPWHELEQNYNVNVGGVLANKQTYNVRLTNRSLQKLEDEFRQAEPDERHFKIVKIIKEEEDFMIECGVFPMTDLLNPFGSVKPKTIIREVAADDLEGLKRTIEFGLRNGIVNGDFSIGETIVYEDEQWTIAEFIPWMKDLCVLLVNLDNTKIADQVPAKKIRKLTPEELSGLKDQEEFIKGKSEYSLDLPTSSPDGETKDIKKEIKKNKKKIVEGLYEDKTEDLISFINNDPDTFKKEVSPVSKNLVNKWNDGSYNRELANKSFKQIAESAGKRFFISQDGVYEGKKYGTPRQMFPEEIITQVARTIQKVFENQTKSEMISEAIKNICESGVKTKHNSPRPDFESGEGSLGGTDGVNQADTDQLTIGAPFSEDDPEKIGNRSSSQENIPFTTKEKEALQKSSGNLRIDILNNAAVISWDGTNGLTKLTISKTSNPQQKTFSYSSISKINNNLDKDRTKNSSSFDTSDDIDVLSDFLASLKIKGETLEEDTKAVNPLVHVKYVNTFPIRDDKIIKSETIGNTKYIYKLTKDMKKYKKPSNKAYNKNHKNKKYITKTKNVTSYPIRNGKASKSEVIGNILYRYKTRADKKIETEKRKLERKKGIVRVKKTRKLHEEKENQVILKSAAKDNAVIEIDGVEKKINKYQSFNVHGQSWIFTGYYPPEENDENEPSIIITKVGKSPTERTQIISLVVDEPKNL